MEVDMTIKITPDQIAKAIITHFDLPSATKIVFELENEGGGYCEKFGSSSSYKVGHAKCSFKKELKDMS